MKAISSICQLAGALAKVISEGCRSSQSSEFDPQCKLDLPLAIQQLSRHLARARLQGFRERAQMRSLTREYAGAQVIAAEVWMVQDVKEFCAKLQNAGFSQKP